MSYLECLIYLILVGLLWGGTNPFLKKITDNIEAVESDNFVVQFFHKLARIFINIPFLLNQCGSLVYFLTLQGSDLSFAVPIANSVTFLVTGVVGIMLGEEKPDKRTLLGICLLLSGISLCVMDKFEN